MPGSATMARPKKKAAKLDHGPVVVNIKVSHDYKAWLDGLAIHCRTDMAKLIDRGLIMVAKAEGYNVEAPPR